MWALVSGNGQQAAPVPVGMMIYGTLILDSWIWANILVRGQIGGDF